MLVRQVVQRFSSRTLDGIPMYPGDWLCTYAQVFPGVWVMIGMELVP